VKISVGCNRVLKAGKIADVNDEADLMRRRVRLFSTNYDLTVCPYHRFKLGIDFWQGKNFKHPKHTGNGKVFRGISSYQSQRILEKVCCSCAYWKWYEFFILFTWNII